MIVDEFQNRFYKEFIQLPYNRLEKILLNHYTELYVTDRINFNNWLEKFIIENKKLSAKNIATANEWSIKINPEEYKIKIDLLKSWLKKSRKHTRYPKFKKSKIDIIDLINFDISLILQYFQYQINKKEAYRYFIASNRQFLDYENLGVYLRETSTLNDYKKRILENFIKKLDTILKLYNNEITQIENETDKKGIWNSLYIEGFGTFSSNRGYKQIKIENLKESYFNLSTRDMRVYFFNHFIVEDLGNYDFAIRCNQLIGRITGFLGINDKEEFNKLISSENLQKSTFTPVKDRDLNPYPHIFINADGYNIFNEFVEKINNKKNAWVDCSFIYRKMLYDKLIRNNGPKQFIELLHELKILDLKYNRLKTMNDIGNKDFREITYNQVKDNLKT